MYRQDFNYQKCFKLRGYPNNLNGVHKTGDIVPKPAGKLKFDLQ